MDERAVAVVASLLGTLAIGGLLSWWMWSLMVATVVASLVSKSQSAAAEVARFTSASRYSGGGWVLLGL